MSIATEISRLQTAKSNLKTSIENKGITVSSATTLDGYAALVDQISGGGGATEYVCPSRIVHGGGYRFFISDVGLSASDFVNDSHTIMWVEWTTDQLATVWLDSMDDDDFLITIPSGTKAFCSSFLNGEATFAFCGLSNNGYGFFTLEASDYPYEESTDSTSMVTFVGSEADSPLKNGAIQSATYKDRNNGYFDAFWAFANSSLHILKF